ncbi:MAG TPA: arginine deiminase family protein [Vicinamibacterales bacterium]|nr:arginine deiminase family protein [Vicinamibacterales bacterium]
MFVAITRAVSPAIAACELTHLSRLPIDVERAREQHRAYERALIAAGGVVERLESDESMPDSVFVEDVAIVLDELAVITRPGAASRRHETAAVADALAEYRSLATIEAPATIDGGDVLVVGRDVFVGLSSRTNNAAVQQMRAILGPRGYAVHAVKVRGCLHLKSAVTALDDGTLLVNRQWIDGKPFDRFSLVDVDPAEPAAANALRLPDRVVFPSAFPRTAERLAARGFRLEVVDASELAKAEGAVTCCSLIVMPAVVENCQPGAVA